ncbi:MAG TPA: hypothetical protein VKX49_26170 [Bryobacteraceae bacterium]|nr:hypothetical protein [Bryobacteraceae bacterium]
MSTSPNSASTKSAAQIFADAYWASQPTPVQALRALASPDRITLAMELAQQGFVIDVPIMVGLAVTGDQMDPLECMTIRQVDGLSWVPSALQPSIGFLPGGGNAPYNPYDPLHPPAGAIKVSTSLADYPPFAAPAPIVAPANNVVGPLAFGSLYAPGPGAMNNGQPTVKNGQQVTQNGQTFTARVVMGLMGWSVSFTLNS